MKFPLLNAILLIAAYAINAPANGQIASKNVSDVVTTAQVQAQLLAHAPQGVAPGQPLMLGLQITHQPKWHTYWKNAGDSGLPTDLQWTLPAGMDAGEIAWPLPQKIPVGNLANYGYEGTVLLPVPVTVSDNFKPGLLSNSVDIKLRASWLVCKEICIPEEGEFSLQLPLKGSTAANGAAFDATLAAQPKAVDGAHSVTPQAQGAGASIAVQVANLPAAWRGKTLEFFPEDAGVIETAAKWTQAWAGDVWTAQVPLTPQRAASPTGMALVVALADGAQRTGLRAQATVQGAWPNPTTAAAPANATNNVAGYAVNTPATGQKALNSLTLWTALLGALIGGLILNLMPCVFPVLAIKVLGFSQQTAKLDGAARTLGGGGAARTLRLGGLAYTLGVVLSFMALGALLLALRAGGEALGWGFQLQSPTVVAALALLFTVLGLNLSGLFEFGQFAPQALANLHARHPVADSFLSGVLATAVASPCTAPFMGASLGFAIDLPAAQALLVFAAIGLGMALPYLLASFSPAVAKLLPRPGAWMDTFKKFMAFPMYATVVWLVWVLGHLSGLDGAGALLALLVAVALLLWALGLGGRARAWVSAVGAASLAGLLWWLGPNVVANAAPEPSAAQSSSARWQPWSPGKVEQLLAQGQPVFVDYTAAWCVTCQYNKKAALADAAVLQAFEAKKVQLLQADWTRRDSAITASLAALGRNGVPVYVLHAPNRAPVVLSEILSADALRAAIDQL